MGLLLQQTAGSFQLLAIWLCYCLLLGLAETWQLVCQTRLLHAAVLSDD